MQVQTALGTTGVWNRHRWHAVNTQQLFAAIHQPVQMSTNKLRIPGQFALKKFKKLTLMCEPAPRMVHSLRRVN